jgi:hypothetical protein
MKPKRALNLNRFNLLQISDLLLKSTGFCCQRMLLLHHLQLLRLKRSLENKTERFE